MLVRGLTRRIAPIARSLASRSYVAPPVTTFEPGALEEFTQRVFEHFEVPVSVTVGLIESIGTALSS